MPRTPAKLTQADVARAIRAAKASGAGSVEIRPDGTIVIPLQPATASLFTSDYTAFFSTRFFLPACLAATPPLALDA